MMKLKLVKLFTLFTALLLGSQFAVMAQNITDGMLEKAEEDIQELMDEGDIPGLSIVLIDGDKEVIKGYGYANLESEKAVTPQTLFELGSTTKAFTAMAVTRLEQEGKLDLNKPVSEYIPWFEVSYEGEPTEITLSQLMYHTSGIGWNTISNIPADDSDKALENTVRTLEGIELNRRPGAAYEYATINYDVLALVIQEVSGLPFETYLQENVIASAGMENTTVGEPVSQEQMATGYKISFLQPVAYEAPVYRGNYAAGYVVTNAQDMAKWLKLQMGTSTSNELSGLVKLTHERDESVSLHGSAFYARGWETSLNGSGNIYHGGNNPNFTSYIIIQPEQNRGVAVLANSNSSYTAFIAERLMTRLEGQEPSGELYPSGDFDKMFSGVSVALIIYCLIVLAFIGKVVFDIIKRRRKFTGMSGQTAVRYLVALLCIVPVLYGVYLLPKALAEFSWESIIVWMPQSFVALIGLLLGGVALTYLAYLFSLLFPEPDKYKRVAPQVILMSLLSGLANVVVITLVTSGLGAEGDLKYLIFYYALVLGVYLIGRRFVQVQLIKLTRDLIYDMSVKLINKVFSTSYQNFEKMDRGRVYTTFNDDVNTIGQSTNMILTLITSVITALGAFVYLASIATWATLLTIGLIFGLFVLYGLVSAKSQRYYEEARDAKTTFMTLLSGMVEGFREISLRRNKKIEYRADVAESADEYRTKIKTADVSFVNAFLVGESFLVVLLGFVSFGMRQMFPELPLHTIMSFVIVLLYLIGPINGIMMSVPEVLRVKVSWKRVNSFIKEVPATLDLNMPAKLLNEPLKSIEANDLQFTYQNKEGEDVFSVGPVNLKVSSGEILFIVGGNGSGKTTFAKLMTGLYAPTEGDVLLNGKKVSNDAIGEYFSTVFAQPHLFPRIYDVAFGGKEKMVQDYLETLDLVQKVDVKDGRYSTIEFSSGQLKRLALLQCYLEDSPIYLFDEWAADQDPEYRHFFYRTLLPEMRKKGKIVIAITHDDQYFDVADKVVKLDRGTLTNYTSNSLWENEAESLA